MVLLPLGLSPCLVYGVVARAKAPRRIAPIAPCVAMGGMVGWAGRQAEVHEVGNGRLALAVLEGTHGERLGNGILVRLPEALRRPVLFLLLLRVAGSR